MLHWEFPRVWEIRLSSSSVILVSCFSSPSQFFSETREFEIFFNHLWKTPPPFCSFPKCFYKVGQSQGHWQVCFSACIWTAEHWGEWAPAQHSTQFQLPLARPSWSQGFSQDASGNAWNEVIHCIFPTSEGVGTMPPVQFSWDCICLLRHRGKVTARAFLFNTKELLVFKNDLETAGQVFDLTTSVHAMLLVRDSSNRASGQLAQCMQWRWVKWNADFKWGYWHNSISIREHWNSGVKLYTNNRGNLASRGVTL